MATITRGTFPKSLWPGVRKFWGANYNRHPATWPKIFEALSSKRSYEEDVEEVGMGLLSVKPEGSGVTYDTVTQGAVSRYTHLTYATGFMVTMEELADNQYEELSFRRTSRMARSVSETEETVCAQVFNRAFNTSFTGGDGSALSVTTHSTASGSQSNRLTTDADISEAAIEDLCVQISDAVDSRGLRISNQPDCLIVPNASWFEANRIVKSVLQNDTANNATNVIRSTNVFPGGIIRWPYLTDTDAWFIKTNCMDGLIRYSRMKADIDQDNDFDTKNFRASVVTRFSVGWTNWRQLYASQGA